MSDSLRPHGLYSSWILQARILEWVAFPFSRGSSPPRDQTQVSHIVGGFFTSWAKREAQGYWSGYLTSFSSRSSPPRNQTRVSCIAGGFFTNWAIREAHAYHGTWERGGSRQLPWSLIGDTVRSSYNIMSRVEAQINLSHRLCNEVGFKLSPEWLIVVSTAMQKDRRSMFQD